MGCKLNMGCKLHVVQMTGDAGCLHKNKRKEYSQVQSRVFLVKEVQEKNLCGKFACTVRVVAPPVHERAWTRETCVAHSLIYLQWGRGGGSGKLRVYCTRVNTNVFSFVHRRGIVTRFCKILHKLNVVHLVEIGGQFP